MGKLDALAATTTEIAKTHPGAIIMITAGKASTAFIREYLKTGERPQFFGVSVLSAKALLADLGNDAHGIVIAQVVPSPLRTSYVISKEFTRRGERSQQQGRHLQQPGRLYHGKGVRRGAAPCRQGSDPGKTHVTLSRR